MPVKTHVRRRRAPPAARPGFDMAQVGPAPGRAAPGPGPLFLPSTPPPSVPSFMFWNPHLHGSHRLTERQYPMAGPPDSSHGPPGFSPPSPLASDWR